MWFSFNLSIPLHWYTVHIVFVFNFCFSSLLVLLVEMKKKKKNMRWQLSQSGASEKLIR